jgi:hypothetical protein
VSGQLDLSRPDYEDPTASICPITESVSSSEKPQRRLPLVSPSQTSHFEIKFEIQISVSVQIL